MKVVVDIPEIERHVEVNPPHRVIVSTLECSDGTILTQRSTLVDWDLPENTKGNDKVLLRALELSDECCAWAYFVREQQIVDEQYRDMQSAR